MLVILLKRGPKGTCPFIVEVSLAWNALEPVIAVIAGLLIFLVCDNFNGDSSGSNMFALFTGVGPLLWLRILSIAEPYLFYPSPFLLATLLEDLRGDP